MTCSSIWLRRRCRSSQVKYQFENIGEKSATAVMLLLAATPWGVGLTVGIQGTILHWMLKWVFVWCASNGLVLLNIGIADIETSLEKSAFDGSLDSAFALIDAKKDGLTDAEKIKIDARVISAFNKFASFGHA